ncbi:uncharacterized protein LOC123520354 [Portunus trituberculatus]|uniref:uncharacterized protein LOC123520354 n=1 Tax=Portunus trituberculatus TaxID=210409 RepID=UPI001E1CCC8D|nr:uncharacterized protein LOC123520354 [Portunus trituberculatus]
MQEMEERGRERREKERGKERSHLEKKTLLVMRGARIPTLDVLSMLTSVCVGSDKDERSVTLSSGTHAWWEESPLTSLSQRYVSLESERRRKRGGEREIYTKLQYW